MRFQLRDIGLSPLAEGFGAADVVHSLLDNNIDM